MPDALEVQQRKAKGRCTTCGAAPALPTGTNCERCREARKQRYKVNKVQDDLLHREYVKEHFEQVSKYGRGYNKHLRDSVRQSIIKALGTCCSECGFADTRILEIDHVNGGGSLDVKQFGGRTVRYYKAVLRKVEEGSKEYQLLCPNCHTYKTLGINPKETEEN